VGMERVDVEGVGEDVRDVNIVFCVLGFRNERVRRKEKSHPDYKQLAVTNVSVSGVER
jgi:hypothetical protein